MSASSVTSSPVQPTTPQPDLSSTPIASNRSGFWALIATQFQGAFSNNVLQYLLLGMILGMGLGKAERDRLVPVVMGLFALPFILFSMAGGFLADRFSKRQVTT